MRTPWPSSLCRALALPALALALAHCGSRVSVPLDTGLAADAASEGDAAAATDDGVVVDDVTLEQDSATDEDAALEPDAATEEDAASAPDGGADPGYDRLGPLRVREVTESFRAPSETGCSGNACEVALRYTLPEAPGDGRAAPYPLAVFSNGFQLDAAQYQTYATRLASWGYVVVRWNTRETVLAALGHRTLARMLRALLDHATAQGARAEGPLAGQVDGTRVVLAGHSRGGKVSVLAALADERVRAVVALDPVDSAPPLARPAEEYPSAVTGLRESARAIPLLLVGAGQAGTSMLGMPCAPPAANYTQFWQAARSPAWEYTIPAAGHMAFVENPACGLTCSVCAPGTAPADRVRAFSAALLVAWAERATRGADVRAYGAGGAWFTAQAAGAFATGRLR